MSHLNTEASVDLTAALRSAARLGFHEGVCNHFSLTVPGEQDRFLINPQGIHWSEITPADLVVVDAEGRLVEGRHAVEPTAFYIHSRIHRAKKNATCILHTHAVRDGADSDRRRAPPVGEPELPALL